MVDKEYIRNIISLSESDILFEKYIGLLDNDFDIIYEPKGLFNRGILKDTGRVYKGRENHLFVEINRPGLYDVMPKGLFHDKLDDINNQEEFFDKIEKERQGIRRLFLPFDSTILSATALVERENVKHFKNKFDSKIAFELLSFFRVFEEIDFLSLVEILFIDFFRFQDKKPEVIVSDVISSVLSFETTYKGIILQLMELCEGNSMLLRFLDTLPYSFSHTADLAKMQKILHYIFDIEIHVKKQKDIKVFSSNKTNNFLLDVDVNTTNQSFILGNKFFDEIEKVVFTIDLDKQNLFILNRFQAGSLTRLLKLFNSFFLPIHFEEEIEFNQDIIKEDNGCSSSFLLEIEYQKEWMQFIELGKKIRKSVKGVMENESWVKMSPGTELRLELIDYLNLFYLIFFSKKTNHTFLNMNSKI